jgi:hypothetical protein
MFVLSRGLSATSSRYRVKVTPQQGFRLLAVTLGTIAAINTAIYWYTMTASGYSFSTLFLPEYFIQLPQEADVSVRTILQYDHICSYGAGLLWLALEFWYLIQEGIYRPRFLLEPVVVTLLAGALLGPGNLFLLGWLSREAILIAQDSTSKLSDENIQTRKTQ